jgi:BMFP domain-containing protein YqiC
MALAYNPRKLKVGQPPDSGVVTPRLPAPVTPTLPKPPIAYKPDAPVVKPAPTVPSGNSGVVTPRIPSPPTLPPPVDLRKPTPVPPTPNDRPVPPIVYKPPTTPAPILPGAPPPVDKGGTQRVPNGPTPTPPMPYKPPVPTPTPPVPYTPPVPVPNRPFDTRTTPVPTIPPPKDGSIPVDPTGGRGQVPDTDPRSRNYVRRNETTEQRIKRLEAKLRAKGGTDADLQSRIAKLKERMGKGEYKPSDPTQDEGTLQQQRVQLDDDPDTWTPEMLAELALPRGMDTIFYDNAKSTDKKPTDPLTGKPKKGDSDNDGTPDVNEVRQGESWEQRLKRLQEKKKANGGSPQINKRIKALKKKLGKSGGKDKDDKKPALNQPTLTGETNKKNTTQEKTSQVPTNDNGDRKGENLPDRLARLKEKLKNAKTEEQKAQLRKRIAQLEARIKVGDTKGNTTDQPGTPTRPYRNRGTTAIPMKYGGTLRI